MNSRSSLVVVALSVVGLFGAEPSGCILFQPPAQGIPPAQTSGSTGGSTGATSSGGSGGVLDAGGCEAACGSLDETDCRARSDCQAIYVQDGCAQKFDHCQAAQCPALMCPEPADPSTCVPVLDDNGCPTCQCQPPSCASDADCPAGDFCSMPDCDIWGPCPATAGTCEPLPTSCTSDADCPTGDVCAVPICDPGPNGGVCSTEGTCQPSQICPTVACDPAPGATCTTTTGPDGCPTCSCTSPCTTDADCTGGQVCRPEPTVCDCANNDPSCTCGAGAYVCSTISCSTDADCASGESCEQYACPMGLPACDPTTGNTTDCCPSGGQCVATPPPACASDADCAAGQVCVSGACQAAPTKCSVDSDCPSNQICGPDFSQCPPGTAPACELICENPYQGCTQDSDCPSGEVCAADPNSACGTGGMECPTQMLCQQPAKQQTYPCGQNNCNADEVCVFYGGAQNEPLCVAYPQACSTGAACDCVGSQICGSSDTAATTDCSGAIPYVNCMYP